RSYYTGVQGADCEMDHWPEMCSSARVCGLGGALQSPSAPRSIHQCDLECLGCGGAIALFEKQLAQLFASREDGAWGDGELFDAVFVIGGAAENGQGMNGVICSLGRPGFYFALHVGDLGSPVGV